MGGNKNEKAHFCPHHGCKSAFNRPYRLAQHILSHDNVRPYVCKEENCTKSYSNKSHLDRHINSAHKQKDDGAIYSCPTCLKEYINRQNLKRHIKTRHTVKVFFTCDICNIDYKKKHQLSAHMYYHTGVKAFSCHTCLKEFKNIVEKKKHLRQHKIFNCELCNLKFHQWSKYQNHLKTTHRPKEYQCNECGRIFKLRAHIIRHLKQHDTKNSFQCPYDTCNRFYSKNFNLLQHIQIVHENKKHPCDVCDAQLATKAKLKEHILKVHLKTGPKKPIKTKATGRKIRKDKMPKVSMALKLSGLCNTYYMNNNENPETVTSQEIV